MDLTTIEERLHTICGLKTRAREFPHDLTAHQQERLDYITTVIGNLDRAYSDLLRVREDFEDNIFPGARDRYLQHVRNQEIEQVRLETEILEKVDKGYLEPLYPLSAGLRSRAPAFFAYHQIEYADKLIDALEHDLDGSSEF